MTSPEVLLITADPAILQRAQRVIAAARRTVLACPAADAVAGWADADAVLIGVDALDEVAKVDPHRRDRVFVIAVDRVPDAAWRLCVAIGACDALALDESEGWLVDRLALGPVDPATGHTVCIRGAVGGAGASVLTAGLAIAAIDEPIVVLDTDLRSSWIDLLLGVPVQGVGWSELAGLRGRVSGDALVDTVPRRDGIALVTADRDRPAPDLGAQALRSGVLAAASLGGTVLIDDCRDAVLSPAARQLSDVLLIVTTSDLRGGMAARRALDDLVDDDRRAGTGGPVIVVARTPRRGALPTGTFGEFIDRADDCFWIRELTQVSQRVASGQPGLRPRERFVADCAQLLDLSRCAGELAA